MLLLLLHGPQVGTARLARPGDGARALVALILRRVTTAGEIGHGYGPAVARQPAARGRGAGRIVPGGQVARGAVRGAGGAGVGAMHAGAGSGREEERRGRRRGPVRVLGAAAGAARASQRVERERAAGDVRVKGPAGAAGRRRLAVHAAAEDGLFADIGEGAVAPLDAPVQQVGDDGAPGQHEEEEEA